MAVYVVKSWSRSGMLLKRFLVDAETDKSAIDKVRRVISQNVKLSAELAESDERDN